MSKTLPVPTNSDYVFKRIFGDERNIDSLHAFRLYDPYHKVSFGDIIEVHTLELPKLPDTHDGTKLWDWLAFFKSKDESQLKSLAKHNKEVAQVVSAYKNMTVEEIEQIKEWESDRAARNKAQFIADEKRKAAAERENEIALRLLKMGLSVQQISEGTGLSLEKIRALSQ